MTGEASSGPARAMPRRVAMVGAGQLARMTHQAAVDLDVQLLVLAGGGDEPAAAAGAGFVIGRPEHLADLVELAERADVLTLDHELVPGEHLRELERRGVVVRPGSDPLALAQDKLHARRLLAREGFPVPDFTVVRDRDDVEQFAAAHGWPVVIKAPRGGYDGRGVDVVGDVAAAGELFTGFSRSGRAGAVWLAEPHLELERELAVVLGRRPGGELRCYPVVETRQRDGICVELVMPAQVPAEVAAEATALATRLADHIGATGICAVELFYEVDGSLSVNEIALRPHNSGHATIEACVTSQFHQHLRAVLDWELGDPSLVAPAAATVNLIGGGEPADPAARLASRQIEGAAVHLYGKSYRPGRKLGHVTSLADTTDEALERARQAAALLMG
ncbi:MAG TPA: 5-(carboxyamino)imidazole ribonucleotide synthase [Acidimicrobiales bacterium]|nr:5-(carboxyamino)imidazole ribonucleotide synthase [Acidimicrobiales bacterium]